MTSRFPIERIEARILDIPTIRPHKLSFGSISRQSPVIVQLWLANGACLKVFSTPLATTWHRHY
jgi:muconate cycloisomerase